MNEWMVRWSRSQPAAHAEEEGWKDGEPLTEIQLAVVLQNLFWMMTSPARSWWTDQCLISFSVSSGVWQNVVVSSWKGLYDNQPVYMTNLINARFLAWSYYLSGHYLSDLSTLSQSNSLCDYGNSDLNTDFSTTLRCLYSTIKSVVFSSFIHAHLLPKKSMRNKRTATASGLSGPTLTQLMLKLQVCRPEKEYIYNDNRTKPKPMQHLTIRRLLTKNVKTKTLKVSIFCQ